MPSLIGAVGTAFMAVFISISSAIFAPVQCEGHPNGYQTVQAYPQVICWSTDYGNGDTHTHMVILASIASVVPISFVALCLWVVQQLPRRTAQGDMAFLHAFAFLFFRFQPRAFWYVLVLLGRNLASAMVPVIADGSLQLFCLTIVLGPCVVACSIGFPWRIYTANLLDLSTNMGFLLILFLAGLLTEGADETMIANMITAIFLFLGTVCALVVFKAVYDMMLRRGRTYQFFLCHHKQGGGGFTRLLKLRLKRDHRVKREVFLDADNLQDLNLLFGLVCDEAVS